MENNIKQRLMDFLAFKKIGQGKFESMTKLSNGYINNLKSSIGSDKLQNIIYVFPDLNILWLLTGNGNMINSLELQNEVADPPTEYKVNIIDYKNKYLEVLEEIKNLSKETIKLQNKIITLQEGLILNNKKRQNNHDAVHEM